MGNRNIDELLNGLLVETYRHNENGANPPYQKNRIFTNRNIKLSRIQAIGFDMDYTLVQYEQDAIDRLTMQLALNTLVEANGYPENILSIPHVSGFAIRGLVMDTKLGNVLKMDKFRYVSLAYHGLRPLKPDQRSDLYNKKRIRFNGRYRVVDTLFESLETYLFAALVDHMDRETKNSVDYPALYKDLRAAIDLCHRDGSLKKVIMAHPEIYFKDDLLLIPALHKFREAGKHLFVLTNSEAEYTEFVLSYLFRNASPFFRNWRSCFEMVGVSACKPKFFTEGTPLEIIDKRDSLFFSGGNIAFLEEKLQFKGNQVLYVGDHIYGDILKSKNSSCWRTCIIIPELDFQIRTEQKTKPLLLNLQKNENRRKQLSMELNWRRSQMLDLLQFKEAEADELNYAQLKRIDDRIAFLNRQLEANNKDLSQVLNESRALRRQISNAFNPYWGRLFKTGGELSLFAVQIRDYACVYTSAVTNFNFYSSHSYLESMATPMPHEDDYYVVNDLNFDVSLDETEAASGLRKKNIVPLKKKAR